MPQAALTTRFLPPIMRSYFPFPLLSDPTMRRVLCPVVKDQAELVAPHLFGHQPTIFFPFTA